MSENEPATTSPNAQTPGLLVYSRDGSGAVTFQAESLTAEDCAELSIALWSVLPPHAQIPVLRAMKQVQRGEQPLSSLAEVVYSRVYGDRVISAGFGNQNAGLTMLRVIPGGKSPNA